MSPARLACVLAATCLTPALGAAPDDTAAPPSAAERATADAPKADGAAKPADPPAADAKPKAEAKPRLQRATFAGGCFWSMEAVFERVPGVLDVTSGFAGGSVPNPSYEMVGTGTTGHAESVHVVFDSAAVTYEQLLKVFWAAHDPTTLNQQGDDFGPQYRSVIFFHDDDQRKAALKSYQELKARRAYREPIVTELVPFRGFAPAEPYHQNYYANHPDGPYAQIYIEPKLHKLAKLIGGTSSSKRRTAARPKAARPPAGKSAGTGVSAPSKP